MDMDEARVVSGLIGRVAALESALAAAVREHGVGCGADDGCWECVARAATPPTPPAPDAVREALALTHDLLDDEETKAVFVLAHVHGWRPSPEWTDRVDVARKARLQALAASRAPGGTA
jgi:hypothetical protein